MGCCGSNEKESIEKRKADRLSNYRQEEALVANSESLSLTIAILNEKNVKIGQIQDEVKSKQRVRAFLRKCATDTDGDSAKVDVGLSEAHLLRLRLIPNGGLETDEQGRPVGSCDDWVTLDIDSRFEEFAAQGLVSVCLPGLDLGSV